jgi:hypothetical protein
MDQQAREKKEPQKSAETDDEVFLFFREVHHETPLFVPFGHCPLVRLRVHSAARTAG